MQVELEPCPFCGGEAELSSDYSSERDRTRWSIWHECCEHEGEGAGYGRALFPWFETPWYDTKAEAIEAWNTRYERTCHIVGLDLEEGVFLFGCSKCGMPLSSDMNYCPNCGAKVIA